MGLKEGKSLKAVGPEKGLGKTENYVIFKSLVWISKISLVFFIMTIVFTIHRTIALISHTSKVMLTILQARLQQYMNRELPDVQAGFRKVKGTRDKIANICWIIKKAREFQKKYLLLLYWLCQTTQTTWSTTNCGEFLKRWEYQTNWLASWEICMQVRKPQLELDMEQQTGSK